MDGVTLTFHLAGINNQNFLMRDEETGSYWQQISGRAISGPLAGKTLRLIHCDELTFALWKTETSGAATRSVMKDVAAFVPEYSPTDWDVKMKQQRTVISHAEPGLGARDLMVGVHAGGAARAFPYEAVRREKLILDQVGSEPVLVVLGSDHESVRVFSRTLPGGGGVADFYRLDDGGPNENGGLLVDSIGGSHWNFRGCAADGPLKGACLRVIDAIKDYWFDWREYNPETTVFGKPGRR